MSNQLMPPGLFTATSTEPVFVTPFTVTRAVIVAGVLFAPTPVTRPALETVAMLASDVVHVGVTGTMTLVSASNALAVSCVVPPTRIDVLPLTPTTSRGPITHDRVLELLCGVGVPILKSFDGSPVCRQP